MAGMLIAYLAGPAKESSGPSVLLIVGIVVVVLVVAAAALYFVRQHAARPRCPACAEPVRPEASVCRHCGRELAAAV